MNEFEFKWEVLGMGYEMSQCKCDTIACMVFVTEGSDTIITTVFTKDNLSLKKSTITQQRIVLTENHEQLFDPKKLKPVERPAKREVEDIFGEDNYDLAARYLELDREALLGLLKSNFDAVIGELSSLVSSVHLFKSQKEDLKTAMEFIKTQQFAMQ